MGAHPVVELFPQVTLDVSPSSFLGEIGDFFWILGKVVEFFSPIRVEIVFPVFGADRAYGVHPCLFSVILGNDVFSIVD